MNCFYGMVNQRKALSLICSRHHCQRFLPAQISDTLRAGFEPAQNLSSGFAESSCAVVITTTLLHHGSNAPTYNLSYLNTFFQQGGGVKIF